MTPPAPDMSARPPVEPCTVPCPERRRCLELEDPRHCALYRMSKRGLKVRR
jgi:hypothetical protein